MGQLINCVYCKGQVSDESKECVHCNEKSFRPEKCALCGKLVLENPRRPIDPSLSLPWDQPFNIPFIDRRQYHSSDEWGAYIHDQCLKNFNENKKAQELKFPCKACGANLGTQNITVKRYHYGSDDSRPDYDYSEYSCPSCGDRSQVGINRCSFCHNGLLNHQIITLYRYFERFKGHWESTTANLHPWCKQYFLQQDQSGQPDWSENPPPMPPRPDSKSGSCFIATAVYESPLAPEVTAFRAFRDERLAPSRAGKWFIEVYYATSPPIARLLSRSRPLREMTKRLILNPILHVIEK